MNKNFNLPFFLLGFLVSLLGACSHAGFKIPTPSFFHKSPSGAETTQTGSAAAPARISSTDTETRIPIDPGVTITISTAEPKDGGLSTAPRIGPAPSVVVSSHSESIVTPTAFTPPPPPTASEIAKADGVRVFYYIAGGLILVAAFMAYTGHGKAALIAGAGAVVVPLLANFFSSEWAMRAALIASCLAGALYGAYYLMHHKYALGSVTTPPSK